MPHKYWKIKTEDPAGNWTTWAIPSFFNPLNVCKEHLKDCLCFLWIPADSSIALTQQSAHNGPHERLVKGPGWAAYSVETKAWMYPMVPDPETLSPKYRAILCD